MKKISTIARTLGYKLIYSDTSVSGLLSHKKQIYESLQQHGCVCVKNVNFNPKDLFQFSKGMWKQVIKLPKQLCFNNVDETYPEIARIGNVKIDGTLKKDAQKEADYWHQDGDFWGEQKDLKNIYNCLHTKEEPDVGGETHILDLVDGAEFLKTNRFDVYKRLQESYGFLDIEQIDDFKLYNAKNTLNIPNITKHNLVVQDHKLGRQRLYLSVGKFYDRKTKELQSISPPDVLKIIEKQMGFYSHKWQKGDMLMINDVQVTHRSSGKYSGRRLLIRTQSRP